MSDWQIIGLTVLCVVCVWCILRSADAPRGPSRRSGGRFVSNYTERKK